MIFQGLKILLTPQKRSSRQSLERTFYEEDEKYNFEEALKQPEISLGWALDNDSKTEEAFRLIYPQIFEKW